LKVGCHSGGKTPVQQQQQQQKKEKKENWVSEEPKFELDVGIMSLVVSG
jgi:hypothetical protein